MANSQPVVLSIAGYDPSSGAGVTADIKTLAAHGCYGVSCLTALTVQSTTGVAQVQAVSAKLVGDTLRELAQDFSISAVRIGMLGSGEVVEAVAEVLKKGNFQNIVLDPIFKSSSGASLLEKKGIDVLRQKLLPLSTVITPNADEAIALTGLGVSNLAEMKAAAAKLHELGAKNVVVTGGDMASMPGEKAIDLLSMRIGNGCEQVEFSSERIKSTSTHGTGCAFATALAANLALGKQLSDAVVLSKAFVKKAIAHAHPLGKGFGPLNHLYRLEETPRVQQESLHHALKEH
ncbi:MAG TPA: bifunctional hydroxymethylpyrimidine kinase/phosphomethylpyrimidine kinase [Terriglobales bacterium]|jgi:hydroxymethylpyrimidine/phosphomethylpyrimidine kinase|nr:bifunctional hydroxymethylpyrimidine kinase/phosphomethylpyrimidine kinase [Terriglobales bacterium]